MLTVLLFLYVMFRYCRSLERSRPRRLEGVKPVEHEVQNMAFCQCVETCTCSVMLKQSRRDRNLAEKPLLLALTWMLKSPNSRVEGDMAQTDMRTSESNTEERFGRAGDEHNLLRLRSSHAKCQTFKICGIRYGKHFEVCTMNNSKLPARPTHRARFL